jgi:hypothetical protein
MFWHSTHMMADCREKVWIKAGPEFGSKAGMNMLVKKALHGLKSSGAAFRAFLAETLDAMGHKPSHADPDVWLRPAVKPDGFECCKHVLCHVDAVLCMSHDPMKSMKRIPDDFKLKDDKMVPPDVNLGARIAKMTLDDGKMCWTMSRRVACEGGCCQRQRRPEESSQEAAVKVRDPFSSNHAPWLEESPELKADGVQ